MTSSMGIQLTPGQRCLLDLLQRKLLKTLQSYARLKNEKSEPESRDFIEAELQRLKEKIRRISARQKRFTLEIINGNGNNTIPKESFFEALGLVTKEALSKLNSKTNERRRRTTANPRFSHEAIQAKRALEPLQKRLDSRARDKRESSRKPQKQQQQSNNTSEASSNNGATSTHNNISNNNNNASSTNNNNNNNTSGRGNDQQASGNARASSRSAAHRNRNQDLTQERRQLLDELDDIKKQINSKVSQIKDKRESNKKLEKQNELIRKRGLDIISAISVINPSLALHDEGQMAAGHNNNINNNSQLNQTSQASSEPLDIWIDMKCDESLDGLD